MNGIEKVQGNALFVVSQEDLQEILTKAVERTFTRLTDAKKDTLLQPSEVCEKLHISRTTLWRWSASGQLCPVKVGGKTLYRYADVMSIEGAI